MTRASRIGAGLLVLMTIVSGSAVWREGPGWAAWGMLHPLRRTVARSVLEARAPDRVTFAGDGVMLQGWRMLPHGPRRGTVVYLHGIVDNRGAGIPVGERLAARGFHVVAYDARAHGESDGPACTYGYYEKRDLQRVIDVLPRGPVVLFGNSLGAAVALQTAAEDSRVTAVVALESFSDLRTIAMDRGGAFLPRTFVQRAFARLEAEGHLEIDAVSPVRAAAHITAPVLVIHGADDWKTRPEHSRRIYDALAGPKQFVLVEHASHNQSLTEATWQTIDTWMDGVLAEGDGR
jgi:uncharacterized protein